MLHSIRQLDRILRGEATRLGNLRAGVMDFSARGLSMVLILLGLLYGICMGLFSVINSAGHDYRQLLATTVKVPALFFLTLIVTFPSLYVFNALVGSRLSVLSVLRLLVASLGVMLAVLASFGTIVAFFSACTTSYPFMVLLNVIVFAASGFLGLMFLFQTLHRLTLVQDEELLAPLPATPAPASAGDEGLQNPDAEPAPDLTAPPRATSSALDRIEGRILGPHVKSIFRIWVILFGLVGAQMGWVLRPFIGNPNMPFTFLRHRESNFFEAVAGNLHRLLGW